jgi:hypothetical protein
MDDEGFFLLAIAVVAVGIYLLFPPRYRHWAVFAFLLIILAIFLWGLPFKLTLFILVAALFMSARVLVGKRM